VARLGTAGRVAKKGLAGRTRFGGSTAALVACGPACATNPPLGFGAAHQAFDEKHQRAADRLWLAGGEVAQGCDHKRLGKHEGYLGFPAGKRRSGLG
jgi:hypothetical protein